MNQIEAAIVLFLMNSEEAVEDTISQQESDPNVLSYSLGKRTSETALREASSHAASRATARGD